MRIALGVAIAAGFVVLSLVSRHALTPIFLFGVAPLGLAVAQADEQYEVWILDSSEWRLKSAWRDFEVAWAVARTHALPVRMIRVAYERDTAIERTVVAELKVPHKDE